MYDKTLLKAEINRITKYIKPGGVIGDIGCGEGEGTLAYSKLGHVFAVDKSETRLAMARKRLEGVGNVTFMQGDVLDLRNVPLCDTVISQRLLINLETQSEQKGALKHLAALLPTGGRLILCEGSRDGVDELNELRMSFNMPEIPVQDFNLFLKDAVVSRYAKQLGLQEVARESFGAYFLFTRGIQPFFTKEFDWNSKFNKYCASEEVQQAFGMDRFSRIKIWVFDKCDPGM